MGITDRLELLLRSEFNALRRGTSKDHKNALRELKREADTLRRDEERILVAIRRHRDEAEMWEERASLAVSRGEDSLAQSALHEQKRALLEIKTLRKELREVRDYLTKISRHLNRFQDRETEDYISPIDQDLEDEAHGLDQVSNPRITNFGQRMLRTPISRSGPGDLGSPFEEREAFDDFERIAGGVDHFVASVEADALLSEGGFSPRPDPVIDPEGVRFEEEYRKITEGKRVEDDLSSLKEKFRRWGDEPGE